MDPLLKVDNLTTTFATPTGSVRAVAGLTFDVERGETVALVGESGSGKSVTCLSVLRLLQSPPAVTSGSVLLNGRNLLALSEPEMRAVRGKDVAMIFQEPMTSLNPVFPVGVQIAEAVRAHRLGSTSDSNSQRRRLSKRDAMRRAIELLDMVGIPEPEQRAKEYPHQLSGGMRQRVMIAIAIACKPDLLIADEPTTALDVTIQAQIVKLLRSLQSEFGMGMLFITHDLGVVAEIADRVVVMYAGRAVEKGPVDSIFLRPKMPYTSGLLRSVVQPGLRANRLPTIRGDVPNPRALPPGCAFHPRCDYGVDECTSATPPMADVGEHHWARCLRWNELELPVVQSATER